MYHIKAIPTRYNGVQFRSRLEARWAAFFDLCKWRWDYEPIDLHGWCPDFSIHAPVCKILCEVKPTDMDGPTWPLCDTPLDELPAAFEKYNEQQKIQISQREVIFSKAIAHWQKSQILLLGIAPREDSYALGIGVLLEQPIDAIYDWLDVLDFIRPQNSNAMWREAGNIVQWHP